MGHACVSGAADPCQNFPAGELLVFIARFAEFARRFMTVRNRDMGCAQSVAPLPQLQAANDQCTNLTIVST